MLKRLIDFFIVTRRRSFSPLVIVQPQPNRPGFLEYVLEMMDKKDEKIGYVFNTISKVLIVHSNKTGLSGYGGTPASIIIYLEHACLIDCKSQPCL